MKTFDPAAYSAMARRVAAEGCVLLRNEGPVLPLEQGAKVAVFGRSQFNYYKSGTGSGGLVNTGHVPNITEALELSGSVAVDGALKAEYEAWIVDHPFDVGQGWANEPWYQEEMPLSPETVSAAAERNNAAVVILGRTAGEDKDSSAVEGSYLLAGAERDMLGAVCAAFSRVAVVINSGGTLDMKWVEEYKPGAVMYVWQGGQEGGLAVADVLTGKAAPGGRLSDTIARDIADYPAAGNFGSETRNLYPEDIYVGYRYFETFAPDKVLYPFGFGLTYTTFRLSNQSVSVGSDGNIRLGVTVENTGSRPGREVVQVYCEAPQGKLGQPARSLCHFAKTKELAPGQQQGLSLFFTPNALASFDDSGVTGHKSAWVLEGGEYTFYIGTDVRSAEKAGSVTLPETVVEQLEEACAPVTPFDRLRPGAPEGGVYTKEYEPAPLRTVNPMDRRNERLIKAGPCTGDKGYKLSDVAEGKVTMDDFLSQLSDEDLCCIVRGEGMCSPKVTPGTAGAFGGLPSAYLTSASPPAAAPTAPAASAWTAAPTPSPCPAAP